MSGQGAGEQGESLGGVREGPVRGLAGRLEPGPPSRPEEGERVLRFGGGILRFGEAALRLRKENARLEAGGRDILVGMLSVFARAGRIAAAIPAPDLSFALDRADTLRAFGLRLLGRGGASLWVGREKRAAFLGVGMLTFSLAIAVTFPVALFAIGPIVYGVPHILSDIRYLLARPGLSKRPLFLGALVTGCALGAAGLGVRGALVGAALALAASRASVPRKAAGIGVAMGLFGACQWAGWYADLAFVHLHNFVAVAIWLLWRRHETRLHWIFTALFFGATAAIALGAAGPILAHTGGLSAPWTDLTFRGIARGLAPPNSGVWAERLTVLFVFAQAAHYVVWLRLVPEDDRPGSAPRSYRQTYRAMVKDVGGIVMWLTLIGALLFAVWAFHSVGGARNAYLRAAFFHGHLELIAVAVLWAEGLFPFVPQRMAARSEPAVALEA